MTKLDDLTMKRVMNEAKKIKENKDYMPSLDKDIIYKKSISNIPKRYINAKLEAKTNLQQKLINKIKNNFSNKKLEEASDMLITGSVGTGKTHLSIGLMNRLIEANIYCKYVTEYDLLSLYFMKKYSEFEKFKNTDVLVLDELAKRDLIDWQFVQIEELLSHRYNQQLPTILITNRSKEDFKKFLGNRIVDRLKENKVIVVNLNGKSLRDSE